MLPGAGKAKHIAEHKAFHSTKLIDPSETSKCHLHITRYTFGVLYYQQYWYYYGHLCFLEFLEFTKKTHLKLETG